MSKLNNLEKHQLGQIIKLIDQLNELVNSELTSKWLFDGEPMLMNLMYINFWLAQVKGDSGEYSRVTGNARKYAEAKRRIHKPNYVASFWLRFKACWVASREWEI